MNYTDLTRAVMAYDLPACRRFLGTGVDVNEKMELGTTALHMACMIPAREGIMELLLNHGADVQAQNIHEMTPFQLACNQRSFDNAALLLQYGSNIDSTDQNGNTALHNAVRNTNRPAFDFLCSRGANVHAINLAGETPLTLASRNGNAFIVSVLISRGADVNHTLTSEAQNSVLLLSIISGADDVVLLLIKRGADVMYENRDSENALFLACRLNRSAVVRMLFTELIGIDMDMRQRTPDGFTALMVAAKHNALDAARALLELDLGCDLWMRSTSAYYPATAYELAQQNGHTQLTQLIDSYANPVTTRLF